MVQLIGQLFNSISMLDLSILLMGIDMILKCIQYMFHLNLKMELGMQLLVLCLIPSFIMLNFHSLKER
jgi:hypothetical protein